MRQIFACLLAIVLLFSGCVPAEQTEEQPMRIGHLLFSTTNPSTTGFSAIRRQIAETAGGELVVAQMSDSPESVVSGVKDLIEMGCKGIVLTPVSNAMLPQVMKLCDEAQVYWIVSMRPIHDASLFETLAESEYFLGVVSEDDAGAAEQMVKNLADHGVKTVATYSISNVNAIIEARELGIRRACEAHGIEIVEELVNVEGEAILSESVHELLDLHPDLDAIISTSNSAVGAGVPVLQELKQTDVKFASFDASNTWIEYFDQGIITDAATGSTAINAVVSTTLVVNAVKGTPVTKEAVQITLPYTTVSSSAEYEQVRTLTNGDFIAQTRIDALLEGGTTMEELDAYQAECFALLP